MESRLWGAAGVAVLMVAAATGGFAQTFDVNGQSSSPQPPTKSRKQQSAPQHVEGESSMGWGSSIEVAREARAAQTALQHGDARSAATYAQKAANAAPQNAELWFTLAYATRLSGQYSLSVESYKKGLALKPNSMQGLSGLAQTYARMGRSADAQQVLDQVLAANPTSDVDLQLAGELVLQTDPKKALEFLQRSENAKSSPRTELLLARAYDRTGDSEAAHRMLERARKNAPTNPEVLRAVASYYRDTGKYAEAVQILEGLHAKDPNTLAELAYSYTLAGNTHAAAVTYTEAANRAPQDIEIQLNAAQAALNAGEFDQAGALLKRASQLNPQHYRLFALRGRMDAAEHHNHEAIEEYESALTHLGESVPEGVLYPISLRIDLAQLYRDADETTNADRVSKDASNEIASLDIQGPGRPEFLRLRAATEVDAGHLDAADKDLREALQIEPKNVILLLNYANLERKTNRQDEAKKTYQQALAIDQSNAAALGALGFLERESGDNEAARKYFVELEKKHPDDYVAHLALGDLYSSTRNFPEAQREYQKAFEHAKDNPLIVAGAMNAALEAHQTALASQWLAKAPDAVRQDAQVMREHERYLTMTGNFADSAELGYKVIAKLPRDREGADYLAYDLLFLNRLDEAMKVVDQFEPILPQDRDLPLIAGYVHARHDEYQDAVASFTKALQIDPTIAVGYMNRGYVYNDMRLASKAEKDFRKALEINPQYGEARLGLAYALLQMRRSTQALKEADLAAKLLPDSESLRLVRAEAYRQRTMLTLAEAEYRKALKLNPNNAGTYTVLADVLYRGRKYASSVEVLNAGIAVAPDNAMLQAQLGRSYARLNRSSDALQAIDRAERVGGKDYKVLLVSAEALRVMNRRDQAMTIYARALESSDDDRLQVRMALGRLFAEEGKSADAQQQVAIGFAEASITRPDSISADDYMNAADVLLSIHEYSLAQRMYGRAQALGADETSVAIGMANASLALGDTRSAVEQMASLPNDPDRKNNFEYQMTQGNVYRQEGKDNLALENFVRARQLDPEDEGARTAEMELAEEQGRPINDRVGMSADARVNPIFEDENIYQLDARLLSIQNSANLLPPPRRSVETFAESRFLYRPNGLPPIQGFVAERNAEGTLSFPSELLIQNRNTFDTIFNSSISPMVQWGQVKLSITPGLQYTIRRDTLSPRFISQNLFRQFVYVASNSIADWVSFSGNLIREAGPFTGAPLHSRDFSGAVDFRIGRPWGRTFLLTGYTGRNLLFSPNSPDNRLITEYYQTVAYAGAEHQFGTHLHVSAAADFLRAWRIENLQYAIAQALRPRFSVDAKINDRWSLSATGAWSSGRSFHDYDSITTNFVATYTRAQGWRSHGDAETTAMAYPVRFSFGFGEQSFYNFSGGERTQIVPVAQVNF